MTKIYDISVPIHNGMPVYPGDPPVKIESLHQIAQGNTSNLNVLHLGSHTGTHIDAPRHFEEGLPTVDQLPLEVLVGPAQVLDLTGCERHFTAADLRAAGAERAERILLKTSNSALWQRPDFVKDFLALDNDAADYLVESGVKLVGIDYLSIERFHPDEYRVHHRLLQARMVVLEGVDLSAVEPGDYQLICLPLKIQGGDGAPARAILVAS